MDSTPPQVALRSDLEDALRRDLLGPAGGPEEIVDEPFVRGRYVVGMLAPRGQSALPDQADTPVSEPGDDGVDPVPVDGDNLALGGSDTEDGPADAAPPKADTMLPSSLGLTFIVPSDVKAIEVTARWGRYERVLIEDDEYRNKDGHYRRVWHRTPVDATSAPILLKEGRLTNWQPSPLQSEVVVQGLVRFRDNQHIVTLFLVNGQQEPRSSKDSAWLFQPELIVASPDGAAIFQARPVANAATDEEEKSMAMLYRHQLQFAVGHGVSVHATVDPQYPDRATHLRTDVIPVYEVPATTAPTSDEIPGLAGLALDMKHLANMPDGQFSVHLSPMLTAYEDWIDTLVHRLHEPPPDLQPYMDVARRAVDNCQDTLARIRAGIQLLDSDANAARAFRFANSAMYLQRLHSDYAASVRRGEPRDLTSLDIPANHSWRVFQLAFILLNLPSLTDVMHPDRTGPLGEMTADLLWFPTGGGKTEAYLGLSAYTMAIRRLQGELGGRSGYAGIAVLMRYTLRLLTLQQFQRAATLICACEFIRREDPALWGSEPFRIGLWVGRRTTPNRTKDAEDAVRHLRQGSPTGQGSPHQLTNCPWCGTRIEPGRDIVVETYQRGRCRTFIFCGDLRGECPFSQRQSPDEGIPVLVVDEEIYRRLPSLLIATVDKFAQMPWNGCTEMLFGQVNGYCERHGYRSPDIEDSDSHPSRLNLPPARTRTVAPLRPPDLIIQDELHLISGPLGTLVGLYETVVDRLSSWDVNGTRVRPKIIASTATIRRARTQVHNLFVRRVKVFPPNGLDARDNFFSQQHPVSPDNPGRRYVGICAPGVHQKNVLIRTYIALMSGAQHLYNDYATAADPWMTLVGYFNALRELGGMRRVVDDAISTRLRQIGKRGLSVRYLSPYRVVELTSRISATDIPKILDRLETPFEPPPETTSRAQRPTRRTDSNDVVDVVLATNMISVGVDVSRLGLMVVAGQPKATAEYIQATSRVGRRAPGLVCTVYNWARPRDLSHYERFEHYHATFYQYVEALSVTPFSPRAIDRGLSAVLVSHLRLLGTTFNANDAAGRLRRDHAFVQDATTHIVERAAQITTSEGAVLVQKTLAELLDLWLSRIQTVTRGAQLGYKQERDSTTVGLLEAPGHTEWSPFTCLNSLRDVEPTVNLILDNHGLDDDGRTWTFSQSASTKHTPSETPVESEAQ